MFWHKKEEAHGLPDLPPVKILSQTDMLDSSLHEEHNDEESFEKHGLPSFPDSPIHKGFSQAAIKDAITGPGIVDHAEHVPTQPQSDRLFKTVELEHWSPPPPQIQSSILSPPPATFDRTFFRDSAQIREREDAKTKDVFVRIDKFYAARKALETTRDKLVEIDELLRKIRETKLREEQELSAWEKELVEIKARIVDVAENIFEKIE